MPKAQGIWRQEWDTCDVCGFLHPIGMLFRQQGKKVCKDHGCYDDLINERRPKVIAEVLSEPDEGTSDKGKVFSDAGEVVF